MPKTRLYLLLIGIAIILFTFYYILAIFTGNPLITNVHDTEGYDLAQNPLWINLTNNQFALEKLEEFKEEYQHTRPKQKEALIREYISLIGVNGILDTMEQDANNSHEKCHGKK